MPHGALAGVRVLEMAGLGPVPFAAMALADMGAEVVRVDRVADVTSGTSVSGSLRSTLRGRRSIAVDVRQAAGAEVVQRLAATSDILLEGFRPGVMERLGLGPDECLRRQPALVYGRMTGWGQDGPRALTAGHDINYIAVAGVLGHIGTPDQPIVPLNLVGDFGGGSMFLLVGVLAGLVHARATGEGQVVDAAMVDGAANLLGPINDSFRGGSWQADRASNMLDGAAPYYRAYETSDGRHVAVGAIEPPFYAALLLGLGLDADAVPDRADRANWEVLTKLFADGFRSRTLAAWEETFAGTDACVSPVLTMADAPADPHNLARGAFLEIAGVEHQPAPAPRLSRTPSSPGQLHPPGAATAELLAELGYSPDEQASLAAADVTASATR